MDLKVVSDNIRRSAKAKDLTLKDLAARAGISYETIRVIAHGSDIRVSMLERIAAALGVKVATLLRGAE